MPRNRNTSWIRNRNRKDEADDCNWLRRLWLGWLVASKVVATVWIRKLTVLYAVYYHWVWLCY